MIYGGGSKQQQLAGLRKKPTILAATPGRLLEFLEDHLALGEGTGIVGGHCMPSVPTNPSL